MPLHATARAAVTGCTYILSVAQSILTKPPSDKCCNSKRNQSTSRAYARQVRRKQYVKYNDYSMLSDMYHR